MKRILTKLASAGAALLALCSSTTQAQTTSENYILSKTYKKPTTSAVSGTDRERVSTTVQYIDGLGRPTQQIAMFAGGEERVYNALPMDWKVNNVGSTEFYYQNGESSENSIVYGTTPFGGSDLLWQCKPDATSGADGGWNSRYFEIDRSKSYRYTIWIKKTGQLNNGSSYHGIQNVNNLDGTANVNPYFWASKLPKIDTWYLIVGLVHPEGYTGSDTGISGLYDMEGKKVANGVEYKWGTASQTRVRSYLYYCTDINTRQYFWNPMFQVVDGSELRLDELVRQKTLIKGKVTPKDIVTHSEYDVYGRQLKEYLPLAKETAGQLQTGAMATEINSYYQAKYPTDFSGVELPEVNAYSEKVVEASPLGRVYEQAAPGKDWKKGTSYSAKGYTNNSHTIKFEYDTNHGSEVAQYYVSLSMANNTYTPTLHRATANNGNYLAKQLYKTLTKDENWKPSDGVNHTTEEFKNKQGQVLLKRTYNNQLAHDTYYVYDDFGNLTYVLAPKMEASTATIATIISKLDALGYQYKYDQRNRLVEKKIPGKGWEYIVYNKRDLPVMTLDANSRKEHAGGKNDTWLYTKYDDLGRVVYTGLGENFQSREAMQGYASSAAYADTEQRTTSYFTFGGTKIYYTKNGLPTNDLSGLLTINYYDTYVDLPVGLSTSITTSYGVVSTSTTRGLATVSKVRVLGTNHWTTTVTYYDYKARPIYVYSKNDYLGTTDVVESKLDDFTGKVLETKTTHRKTGQSAIVTIDRFEYDHADRLVSQTQKINNQYPERIVRNHYDALGQLASKLTGNGTAEGYQFSSGISGTELLTKTNTTTGWNSALLTKGSIQGDGYVEFQAETTNHPLMVGLSNLNSNVDYTSIQYAAYLSWNKGLFIYEGGHYVGGFGSFKKGDVIRVERVGSVVYYKKNNEVFYTSVRPSIGKLFGDVAMYTVGAAIRDVIIVNNNQGLQKVDYNYNIRGWLKNINQDAAVDNDLFNFGIAYNEHSDVSKRLYNGNIAQTSWQTANDGQTRSYTYSYDALNRLLSATGGNTSNYNLSGIQYDKNGNILNLIRRGHLNTNATSFGVMDNLVYTYDSGNKLKKVSDSGNTHYGFKDGSHSNDDFGYDANGNLLSDANKQISRVKYNHLNMPTEIKFNNSNTRKINYTYTADGTKLRKFTNDNGSVTITDYSNDYIYKNGVLQSFNHTEGYLEPNGNGGFEYIYQHTDIWNNVRVSYSDKNNDGIITPNSEILQERNFYPFGLEHKGYNSNVIGRKYNIETFQDQEFTGDLGLDVHEWRYRIGDPAIGRFWQIDPLAEDYVYNSTYAFAENKLGLGIELEGLEITSFDLRQTRREKAVLKGKMTKEQFMAESNAEAQGALAGLSLVLPGPEDVVLAGFLATKVGGVIVRWVTKLFGKSSKKVDDVLEIAVDHKKHPESALHIDEAAESGKKMEGLVDRAGKSKRRRENLKGVEKKKGKDRDEAPPAVINTGEKASVKHVTSSDNRGAGSVIGHQLRKVPDGTKVRIVTKNKPEINK